MSDEHDHEHSPTRSNNTRSIPLSFAYGAPDLSPPKSSPPRTSPTRSRDLDDELSNASYASQNAHEPAAVRYARLKQRNLAHAPHTIVRPPVPGVKDTSVNIASAFNQASMSYRRADSTDDSISTAGRRLAVPPSRLSRINAKNKRATVSPAADDDPEPAPSGRSKSPFNALAQTAARAMSPIGSMIRAVSPAATYLLREGSSSEDPSGFQSMVIPNNSASYDYAQEEEDVATMEADTRGKKAAHRRGPRVSLDDKAYRPGHEEEGSDDEFTDDDGGRKRRKKKKKDSGHLTLPTIGYDKAHKKKKPASKKKGPKGLLDDEPSGSERGSVARSVRGSVPPQVLEPEPEPEDSQVEDTSGLDDSHQMLSEEEPPMPNGGLAHLEAQTPHTRPRGRWFGHALGAVVRATYDLVSSVVVFSTKLVLMLVLLAWQALTSVWRIAVQNPVDWARSMSSSLPSLLQLLAALGVLYFAYFALSGSSTTSTDYPSDSIWDKIFSRPRRPYVMPDVPAADLQGFIERLRVAEAALADTSKQLRKVMKHSDDLDAKLLTAQAQVEKEARRAAEAEEKLRSAATKSLADLKTELTSLKESVGSASSETITVLEQRVASAESDLKNLKNNPVVVAPAPPQQQSAPAWWSKPGTKPVTLKASDGTDVTGLVATMVENALGRLQRDSVGRADYAQFTSGGRVIPGLTSSTFVMQPPGFRRRVIAAVTGYGTAAGHPPAVALHADVSLGNCWPFPGSTGSLGVVLSRPVYIDAITVEHAPREVSFLGAAGKNASSAPRRMEVWGLVDGSENMAKFAAFHELQAEAAADAASLDEHPYPGPRRRGDAFIRLASFEYDLESQQHVQTFPVRPEVRELGVDFGVVVLLVKSNWGEPMFTCLYRFRVHGAEKVEA